MAALRFFFCKTLRRAGLIEEVPYPNAPRRLPTILTQDEAVRLIDSARKLSRRAMLMTSYSTRTCRAEMCQLKMEDSIVPACSSTSAGARAAATETCR